MTALTISSEILHLIHSIGTSLRVGVTEFQIQPHSTVGVSQGQACKSNYSHSVVPGGLAVRSYTTRDIPGIDSI